MIQIDTWFYLDTFEDFERVLLPIINKDRVVRGLDELTPDEAVDKFLDLRKEYGKA